MGKGVDLDIIKNEIEKRKSEQKTISENLGETSMINVEAKDSFLNDLLHSVNSGRPTESTNLIKMVENKVAEKNGEESVHKVVETPVKKQPITLPNTKSPVVENIEDRSELMFTDLNKKKNQGLSETLMNYGKQNMSHPQQPQSQQYLTEAQRINEIKSVVKSLISEDFIREVAKDVIIEMYTFEQMDKAVKSNEDFIKKIMIDIIKKSKRSKENAQS